MVIRHALRAHLASLARRRVLSQFAPINDDFTPLQSHRRARKPFYSHCIRFYETPSEEIASRNNRKTQRVVDVLRRG